ncbi:MAG TPA: amidohydrolase family protein [Parvularculaceae bacterium]|nr:amidohydrolase family protein [Parvularculaceae bacterium]
MILALYMLVGAAVAAAPTTHADETVIHAGVLISEADSPAREKQTIVVANGVIIRIENGYSNAADAIDLSCCVIAPGFIDMHSHVTIENGEGDPRMTLLMAYAAPKSQSALSAAGRARRLLRMGFTTIRNLGDPSNVSSDLRDAIARGDVDGPRMIVAGGAQIGVSGGDYDPGGLRFSEEAEKLALTEGQCDGAEDCRAAVRRAFRRGADVIKLRLSSISAMKPGVKRLEHPEELEAVVETAHELGLRVAAHAFTSDRAAMAIAAGADTIEHSVLTAENLAAMKKSGAAYTPTLEAARVVAPMMAPFMGADFYEQHLQSTKAAYDAGVPVLFGSDLGAIDVDELPNEFVQLAEAGLPPKIVLKAATSAAAKALGMSESIGSLKPGMAADMVAMESSPLKDVAAYRTVVFVMKDGRVFRNDVTRTEP